MKTQKNKQATKEHKTKEFLIKSRKGTDQLKFKVGSVAEISQSYDRGPQVISKLPPQINILSLCSINCLFVCLN